MGKLEGKVCIVTGASSGIGKEISKYFSNEGAKLILAARRLDKLDELAAALDNHNEQPLYRPMFLKKKILQIYLKSQNKNILSLMS